MNTPVKFAIAKLLKAKGWDKPTLHFFFEDGVLIENSYQDTVGMDYGKEFEVEFFELTDNWNKGWVKKKNGSMCLGCDKSKGYLDIYSAPTIAEVTMWFYEKYGIWIVAFPELFNGEVVRFYPSIFEQGVGEDMEQYYNSPTEAYEAAIEFVLTKLI